MLSIQLVSAELRLKIEETKATGNKAVMKLSLKNKFAEKIESARAQVFLLNDEGKVVGQAVQWVIGGTKDKLPLEHDATRPFKFVIPVEKPFTKSKITVTRIILEGGKSIDPKGNFIVEGEGN
ncbi:MAG: hypothetical protein JWM16_1554 [Verrucomicrobiales bacterium]|nr:hypothetical protein [Verrucomicrobiales bacterium]